jgi:uncharacterized protein YndB with AHSA1/START domain
MTVAELSRIDRTIEIKAAPDRVWRALTSAKELSAWFQVSIEGDIAPGAEVWMTSTHSEHAGQRFRVLFKEMTAPHRFVWEWHPVSCAIPASTTRASRARQSLSHWNLQRTERD